MIGSLVLSALIFCIFDSTYYFAIDGLIKFLEVLSALDPNIISKKQILIITITLFFMPGQVMLDSIQPHSFA